MIDTRKAVKELKAVGFSEDQADLVASLFSSTIPWEELVTKEYLSKELDYRMGVFRSEMNESQASLRAEIIESQASLRSEMNELQSSLRSEMNELQSSLRSEMNELQSSLRGEMKGLRMELLGEIQKQSASQIRWIVSMQAVILGIALALSKLL